jgi:O-antigen/teichoic acid export membrane protein
MVFVSFLIGLLLSAVIFLLPVHRLLHFSSMSPKETQTALLLLSLNSLIILQWGSIIAAYRCDGKYALGMLSVNVIRILEGISFLVLLVWHAGPVQLSMLMLGISIVGTSWLLLLKIRLIPWLPIGVRHAKWQCIRELWKPAIAFLAFPTGSAISLQGMTMMVGLVLGPLAVAVFNPMRTLSRPAFQLTDAVKNTVWQELSAAMGHRNWDLARKLHRTACQVSLFLSLLVSIALAISGPRLFALWTHNRIVMNVPTFYILLTVVLVNSLWNASSAVPMAANKHQRLAVVYLISTSVSLSLGYPLILQFGLGGAGVALLLCEIGMSICVVHMSNRLLSDRWSQFATSMIDTTQFNTLRVTLMRLLVRRPGS